MNNTIYSVLCIDHLGVASWESVLCTFTDSELDKHGIIPRTGQQIKFWWDDSEDCYTGTIETSFK
jgi:hypothetical protein